MDAIIVVVAALPRRGGIVMGVTGRRIIVVFRDQGAALLRYYSLQVMDFSPRNEMPAAKKIGGTEKPIVESGPEARQGDIQHRMIWVLIFSLVSAVIVLGLIYRYYLG